MGEKVTFNDHAKDFGMIIWDISFQKLAEKIAQSLI
jgi:hypothetical protein